MNTAHRRPFAAALLSAVACLILSGGAMAATYPQPTVSSFTPASGSIGTVITVTGSGFTGANSAWIGGAHNAIASVVSDTQLKITVPAGAVGGEIAVLNPQHAAFSSSYFTVTQTVVYPYPTISTMTPISGPIGTVITLTGTGFTGLSAAWVDGSHDEPFTVVSDTQVKVTVNPGTFNGRVVLSNPKHSVFSEPKFIVSATSTYAQPVITSFLPASGPVGSEIELKGSGFSGLTSAWIGTAHNATITVVSDVLVEVVVPAGAVTGPINLLNPQRSALSSSSFTVTTPGNNPVPIVHVVGNDLVDGNGMVLQLRGFNVSALEFVAVQGWSPTDPWGGMSPNFNAMKTWKANAVRLPLNEASWLGYPCVDDKGVTRDPDPGHNYRATVQKAVTDASAAGFYVIIGLHWSAPNNFCPEAQNPMADADHSFDFWSSIAKTFKGSTNVIFSLFNEPYLYWLASGEVDWNVWLNGGTETAYVTGGLPYTANYTWQAAGMQQMVNVIRSTGATNVVLVGGINWAQDLSQWVAHRPIDPLQQIAAVWHGYPNSGTVGDPQAALPKFGAIAYTWTQSVLDAQYPVVITEFGDRNAAGTVGAPFVSNLLPWADAHEVSYIGWTWDPWADGDNVLIKDATGTPTDGYGVYTKAHFLCVATGASNCP